MTNLIKATSTLRYHVLAIAVIFFYQFNRLDAMQYYALITLVMCVTLIVWQASEFKNGRN